ncbi:hypothetical protein JOB18_026613 [Solea senegalensis]|uniref:Uncharacterized protein n=1 Tax=Solea senegalensis TaxID=28829 RepID=A0AAV6PYZ1_SOLSE|nr:hypothetical protein JOB18_026613 [Solea senegalensis]
MLQLIGVCGSMQDLSEFSPSDRLTESFWLHKEKDRGEDESTLVKNEREKLQSLCRSVQEQSGREEDLVPRQNLVLWVSVSLFHVGRVKVSDCSRSSSRNPRVISHMCTSPFAPRLVRNGRVRQEQLQKGGMQMCPLLKIKEKEKAQQQQQQQQQTQSITEQRRVSAEGGGAATLRAAVIPAGTQDKLDAKTLTYGV